ncbi:ParB/RepB/Spo0J family partition protein, partial [Kitasatospora sp. NPDC085930]|uniref:ParB/RepB/Spo0J family partition protein n=1 Tax=Kitasatospora sp. NPDC085930 TaxID=3364064 RepID=UPI0037C7863C
MATSGLGGRNLMAARSQAQQLASRQPTASVDDLFPSPTNGRKRLRNIEALAATIATDGLNTALTVVPADHYLKHHPEHTEAVTQAGKPYVVLGGHRRLEAAKAAGLARVAINVVFEVKNIRIASLQENLQREPLTPVEEGEEFQRALTELSLSQRGLAKRLGAETNKRISQTYISQRIALLKLISELQDAVDDHWSGERDTGLTLKFAAEMLARLTHEAQRAFLKGQFSREDVAVATRRRSGELTTDDVTTVLRELAAERLAAGDGQTAADGVIAPQSPPPTATGTGAAEPTGSPEGAVVTAAGQATPDGVIAPQSPSPAVVSAGAAEPTGSPEGAVVTAAGQATPDGVIAPQSPSPAVVSAGAAEPTGSPEGAVVTAAGQATPDGVIAPQSP